MSQPVSMSQPGASRFVRWCSPCAAETQFELPPCEDGHGEDCLDLCCIECGHAVVVGVTRELVDAQVAHAA